MGRSVRRFFADKSPISEVSRLMETPLGYDPAVWTQMAQQLGRVMGPVKPGTWRG
jgi:hypothetical protein